MGTALQKLPASFPGFSFVFLDSAGLNIADREAIRHVFDKHHPDYVVNCAAFTAVDRAETEKENAWLVNATAVGYLAEACEKKQAGFLHISTDYVFSGKTEKPWSEDDPIDPVNYYGQTKAEGEKLALKNCSHTIIFRTSWVYAAHGHNFVKTMIRLMKEKKDLNVVNDQWGSPTYAPDLAEVILQIIQNQKIVPGIYHFSNEGAITWYEFAKEIQRLTGAECRLHPVDTSAFPTPAKRPAYSVLNKEKIQHTFGVGLKNWKESLQQCIELLKAD